MSVAENSRGEVVVTDYSHALSRGGGKPGMGQAVVMHEPRAISVRGRDQGQEWEQGPPDLMVALRAGDGGSSRGQRVVTSELIVRRLSPLERDRLMDWPDDYTRFGLYDDGQTREVATTNRDRITGNGVVAGVTEWIGRRLPAADDDLRRIRGER